jgi:UDP-2,4-diacetamido-2,4,6-trideoxy-beta-L-altropyranose hydrolase
VHIAFRVDGSSHIGLGHIMRCLTLAKQCMDEHDVTFICSELPDHVESLLKDSVNALILLDESQWLTCNDKLSEIESAENVNKSTVHSSMVLSKQAQQKQARNCIAKLQIQSNTPPDILIVDHYQLSSPFCTAMRDYCKHIVVIDDLANRSHDCDVLLDQNLFENTNTRYKGLVSDNAVLLLGPEFAVLKEAFYQASTEITVKPTLQSEQDIPLHKSNHILVCFGGSDPSDVTRKVVAELSNLKSYSFTADIVVGGAYAHVDALTTLVAKHNNMTLHHNTPSMPQLMQKASFMIGAGGSMHWERAQMNLAGLIITIADNQIETTRYLHQRNCCMWLGESEKVTSEEIRKAIEFGLNSPEKISDIANNARSLLNHEQCSSYVMDTIINAITR